MPYDDARAISADLNPGCMNAATIIIIMLTFLGVPQRLVQASATKEAAVQPLFYSADYR